jgi:hypothetical protein
MHQTGRHEAYIIAYHCVDDVPFEGCKRTNFFRGFHDLPTGPWPTMGVSDTIASEQKSLHVLSNINPKKNNTYLPGGKKNMYSVEILKLETNTNPTILHRILPLAVLNNGAASEVSNP